MNTVIPVIGVFEKKYRNSNSSLVYIEKIEMLNAKSDYLNSLEVVFV